MDGLFRASKDKLKLGCSAVNRRVLAALAALGLLALAVTACNSVPANAPFSVKAAERKTCNDISNGDGPQVVSGQAANLAASMDIPAIYADAKGAPLLASIKSYVTQSTGARQVTSTSTATTATPSATRGRLWVLPCRARLGPPA